MPSFSNRLWGKFNRDPTPEDAAPGFCMQYHVKHETNRTSSLCASRSVVKYYQQGISTQHFYGCLIQGVPPASVCYQSEPNYNISECETVTASWFSSSFHANDPISVRWPWWANNSWEKGYRIGGSPVCSVNAIEEAHIVAATEREEHRTCQGRSTGFGTLSVWTHRMRGYTWHDNFQAERCNGSGLEMAATFAAGERDRNVYEATARHNAVIVAGSAQDVGIVGWFTGGGHGPLSSTYGLGIDNVFEVRIVTPDGVLRTANACGGGGTFGVVTSNTTGFWDIVADTMTHFPTLKAGALIAPILQKLDAENGTSFVYTAEIKTYRDLFSVWNSTVGEETVATGGAILGSRLLPASALTDDPQNLARVLQNVSVSDDGIPGVLQAYLIAPSLNDTTSSVSATPAWRSAVLHTIVSSGFPDNYTFDEAQPFLTDLTYDRVANLKSLAPESGSYLNEADAFDSNWQYDFWGANYARLRGIKKRCVGSENWVNDGSGRLFWPMVEPCLVYLNQVTLRDTDQVTGERGIHVVPYVRYY
ncbi:hypothetical protein BDV96DRAFT_613654 [Lophiotrema nucula]|uniref:FAD-binding PCMH-type domain-containing protein n=1 Tax=Lophiotrema nucula TaxID=690887 RepID=A0A6A5Z2Z9_9PLEO|nr:hypothetical protein BDV96DRAFT_613654 [Lophiotrema nucula]